MTHTIPTVQFIRTHPDAKLPTKATEGAAGYDVSCVEDIMLSPGERKLVSTGLKIAVQEGFEVQVRPRSGLAAKHGVTVVNSPGTVDCDYRGPLGVILLNTGAGTFCAKAGERIAQLIVAPVVNANLVMVDEFSSTTARAEGGFGSTGNT